jgi:hypothetical protein
MIVSARCLFREYYYNITACGGWGEEYNMRRHSNQKRWIIISKKRRKNVQVDALWNINTKEYDNNKRKKERAAEVPHLAAAARDDLLALHEFPYCFAYFSFCLFVFLYRYLYIYICGPRSIICRDKGDDQESRKKLICDPAVHIFETLYYSIVYSFRCCQLDD